MGSFQERTRELRDLAGIKWGSDLTTGSMQNNSEAKDEIDGLEALGCDGGKCAVRGCVLRRNMSGVGVVNSG